MTIDEIKVKLHGSEYDFLTTDEHLGQNVILLGLGGSYVYGMNTETSDLDIRGIAVNQADEILLNQDFEQVTDSELDVTIYSFNKILKLLADCNPNTIEMLGLEEGDYLYRSDVGKELVDNAHMFLSKKCIFTFNGYAQAQLRRLENKSARNVSQSDQERHILKSIEQARYDFTKKYFTHREDQIILYLDEATEEAKKKNYETEIFMDVQLEHYPLRDWAGMWNDMKCIVGSYNKMGKRNEHAIAHNKLGKHMAHLIRLYMMGIDILTKQEIITKRRNEHDLLMQIRNGEFLDENGQVIKEFYEILDEYESKMNQAILTTTLPVLPDYEKIYAFKKRVNKEIVMKG